MKSIEIFTDGGCKGNPGPGGYGCIIRGDGNILELKGSHPQTTNNIMADRKKYPKIPTSIYGNYFPKGYELVMQTIQPETVIKAVVDNL